MQKKFERLVIIFSWTCIIVLLVTIIPIIGFLFLKGLKTINLNLIFGDTKPLDAILLKRQVFGGLFPAIIGTLSLVLLSVIWAIPIGISAGIYMAEYARENTKKIFNIFFDILAGIPSIVIGLFGFSLAIFLHKHVSKNFYPCFLISSISLAFLVLPYIIRITQVSLENLPMKTRITALALGATELQNIIYVLLPQSLSGIFSGIILAIGRCAEDTAVIMLTGVVATAGLPKSLFSHYEALPFYIYYISSEYRNQQQLTSGYSACIILLTICTALFFISFFIKKRLTYFFLYHA